MSVCLFVCPDSIKLSGVFKCFYNGDIILIKILFMVNKYADFEFRIYKYILFIFIVVVYKLANRLVRIQNEPSYFIPIVLMAWAARPHPARVIHPRAPQPITKGGPPCPGPPGPWTKGTSRVGHYGPGGALMGLHEQILGPSDHPETHWVLQRCSVNISPVNKQHANRQLEHQANKQVKALNQLQYREGTAARVHKHSLQFKHYTIISRIRLAVASSTHWSRLQTDLSIFN